VVIGAVVWMTEGFCPVKTYSSYP